MKLKLKLFLSLFFFLGVFTASLGQTSSLNLLEDVTLNPTKVQQFEKYVAWKHSFLLGPSFDAWKSSNTMLYVKEMWYYSESFYVKRDSFPTGITLPEAGFDVSRFESKRNW